MKRFYIIFFILGIFCTIANADVIDPTVKTVCINKQGEYTTCPQYKRPAELDNALSQYMELKESSEECYKRHENELEKARKNGKDFETRGKLLNDIRNKCNSDKYLVGFKDKDGKVVIEPKFDRFPGVGQYHFIGDKLNVYKDGKWGVIDRKGNWLIKPKFDLLLKYSEGLAAACLDGKCGYIDEKGNWAIKPSDILFMCYSPSKDNKYWYNYKCKGSSNFSEGLAAVYYEPSYYAYIQKTMSLYDRYPVVFPEKVLPNNHEYYGEIKEGKFYVKTDLSAEEREKINIENESIKSLYSFNSHKDNDFELKREQINKKLEEIRKNNYLKASVRKEYNSGYMNKNGELVIRDFTGTLGNFSEGLAAATKYGNNGYGYIDKQGNYVIKQKFIEAAPFHNGIAYVEIKKSSSALKSYYKNELKTLKKSFDESLKYIPDNEKSAIKKNNKKNLREAKKYINSLSYKLLSVFVNQAYADEVEVPNVNIEKDKTKLIFSSILFLLILIACISIGKSHNNDKNEK